MLYTLPPSPPPPPPVEGRVARYLPKEWQPSLESQKKNRQYFHKQARETIHNVPSLPRKLFVRKGRGTVPLAIHTLEITTLPFLQGAKMYSFRPEIQLFASLRNRRGTVFTGYPTATMKEQESSPARCNKSLCYVHSVYRMYLVRVRARMCMLMQAHMQQVDSQVGNPTHPAKNAPPPLPADAALQSPTATKTGSFHST